MYQVVNGVMGTIIAAASYFSAAVGFAIKNPWFLALTALMLISSGKALSIGRIFKVKG